MADLLFECFCEEIPARMQRAAAEQLQSKLAAALDEASLKHGGVQGFVSPRHLAVIATGLPDKQPDKTTERKGPKTSAPQAAIEGFLKSTGLTLAQCEKRTVGKDEILFATTHEKGKPTTDVLKEILEEILKGFHWPKSQRWGDHEIAWVRPLQKMLCIFDGTVVPVQFGHITASNVTHGHRFLSPDAITIACAADYVSALKTAKVLVDAAERKTEIARQLKEIAAAQKLSLVEDAGLLEEVTGLVEWPTVLVGEFDADYLKLPPEVLVSEMKHHQKYFALRQNSESRVQSSDKKGNAELRTPNSELSNKFLITCNMITNDDGKAVRHGNGRVLRARLEDGAFYWNQDRKKPLSDWARGLADVTFHAKVGNIAEKATRIEALSLVIAKHINAPEAHVKRAAQLCKADLTSGMVGEFPELQGIMGRYYAIDQKEDAAVADAIRDHYKPLGAGGDVPTEAVAICVALADRIDSLACLFAADEKPTGSKDPFALRRAALGMLRIIRGNNLRLPLQPLIDAATRVLPSALAKHAKQTGFDLAEFFADRLKVMLRDEGISHDVVAAVMASGDDDVVRITARAQALSDFLASDDGVNLLAAYRRASNILTAEEKKDGKKFDTAPDARHFAQTEETKLHDALTAAHPLVTKALESEHFAEAMRHLACLRTTLDAYFDKVMVNADDAAIRTNRLNTLNLLRTAMSGVVDFSQIEMKTDRAMSKAA